LGVNQDDGFTSFHKGQDEPEGDSPCVKTTAARARATPSICSEMGRVDTSAQGADSGFENNSCPNRSTKRIGTGRKLPNNRVEPRTGT
jgi:hypothetical protein